MNIDYSEIDNNLTNLCPSSDINTFCFKVWYIKIETMYKSYEEAKELKRLELIELGYGGRSIGGIIGSYRRHCKGRIVRQFVIDLVLKYNTFSFKNITTMLSINEITKELLNNKTLTSNELSLLVNNEKDKQVNKQWFKTYKEHILNNLRKTKHKHILLYNFVINSYDGNIHWYMKNNYDYNNKG